MKKAFCACGFFFFIASCKKTITETCNSGSFPYRSLASEYGCTDNIYETNIHRDTFFIIKNQADYNSTITSSCTPNIDFDTYDLVIGRQQLASGCHEILYDLSKD